MKLGSDLLIPFILHCETGVTPKEGETLESLFARAKKTGYANDPADAGGATMCGITLATFRSYKKGTTVADLKDITLAEWQAVFKTMFWDKWQADKIECQAVANMVVDWTWGSGKYGITRPQKLLGCKADGIVGPLTLGALNGYSDPKMLFEKLKADRHLYHQQIADNSVAKYEKKIGRTATTAEKLKHTNQRFLNGWTRRVNKITFDGFNYNAQ